MLAVKPFKQSDESRCGPASLKMVLDFFGVEASEDELADRCRCTTDGCSNDEMAAAAEFYRMTVETARNAELAYIGYWIERNVPVIVDWFAGGFDCGLYDMPNGHSSVVVGLTHEYIYLLDPQFGGVRQIVCEDFMRVWFDWQDKPYMVDSSDLELRTMLVVRPKLNT